MLSAADGFRRSALALVVTLVVLSSCRGKRETEYEHYVHEACAALEKRQARLNRDYKLSSWERYDWNQDTGELVFSDHGVAKVVATIQFVGSYSSRSRTWRWAWANHSVSADMKRDVAKVRDLGNRRGWRRLTEPEWGAEEQDGWEMTAVTTEVLAALGAYRSSHEGELTFLTITAIRWASPAVAPAAGTASH